MNLVSDGNSGKQCLILGPDRSLKANGNLPVGFNELWDPLLSPRDREYLGFTCTGCRFSLWAVLHLKSEGNACRADKAAGQLTLGISAESSGVSNGTISSCPAKEDEGRFDQLLPEAFWFSGTCLKWSWKGEKSFWHVTSLLRDGCSRTEEF